MNEWKNLIPRCFGSNDHRFARHPSDLENARNMIIAAHQEHVPEGDVKNQLIQYLKGKGCSSSHIEEEMEWFNHGWAWIT